MPTRDDETEIFCPYCGEQISIFIDCSVADQTYVEDCSVCCKPIELRIRCENGLLVSVETNRENR